jgi:hypothetical protein
MKMQLSKVVGVAVCLVGAFLMVWGDPILGENHTGIATIIGIIGIGIITSSKTPALAMKREEGM